MKEDKSLINKLIENIKKTNAPIVVGLDPMLSYVPEQVVKQAFAELGETLEGAGGQQILRSFWRRFCDGESLHGFRLCEAVY